MRRNFKRPTNAYLKKYRAPMAAKSTPGPETSGGWEVLGGSFKNWVGANDIWKDLSVEELQRIYRAQVTVFACIRRIAIAFQESTPKVAIEVKPDVWEDLTEHPLQGLLNQPNPSMSYAEFSFHSLMHSHLTGRSFLWKWRNVAGYVTELWPVPTSWVVPRADREGKLAAYEIFQGQGREPKLVPLRDIVEVRFPDPENLSGAIGPLQAAMRDVQTDEERADYLIEMMSNTRTPGTVLKQTLPWTPEEMDDARSLLSDGLGKGRRGKTLFMSGEDVSIDFPAPLKDLDWKGVSNLSETRICAAFGVPPIIIGLRSGLENATYSNYEQALKSFMNGTMVPLWYMHDSAMTRGLLRDEGESDDSIQLYHDTTDVQALQEDQDKRAERASKLFSGSLSTRNESRTIAGLDPLPPEQGNVYLVPLGLVEVPATTAKAAPSVPPPDKGEKADWAEGDK